MLTGVQKGGGGLGAVSPQMKFKHSILLVLHFSLGFGFLWKFWDKNVLEIALSKAC